MRRLAYLNADHPTVCSTYKKKPIISAVRLSFCGCLCHTIPQSGFLLGGPRPGLVWPRAQDAHWTWNTSPDLSAGGSICQSVGQLHFCLGREPGKYDGGAAAHPILHCAGNPAAIVLTYLIIVCKTIIEADSLKGAISMPPRVRSVFNYCTLLII